MVKLNKIYTRTGDDGTTGLVAGPRRQKHDVRVEAYGDIDETNSLIGQARQFTSALSELDQMLMRIQNDLFDLGADLATPDTGEKSQYEPLRIVQAQVDRIARFSAGSSQGSFSTSRGRWNPMAGRSMRSRIGPRPCGTEGVATGVTDTCASLIFLAFPMGAPGPPCGPQASPGVDLERFATVSRGG